MRRTWWMALAGPTKTRKTITFWGFHSTSIKARKHLEANAPNALWHQFQKVTLSKLPTKVVLRGRK